MKLNTADKETGTRRIRGGGARHRKWDPDDHDDEDDDDDVEIADRHYTSKEYSALSHSQKNKLRKMHGGRDLPPRKRAPTQVSALMANVEALTRQVAAIAAAVGDKSEPKKDKAVDFKSNWTNSALTR